jgi:hypothetical protein
LLENSFCLSSAPVGVSDCLNFTPGAAADGSSVFLFKAIGMIPETAAGTRLVGSRSASNAAAASESVMVGIAAGEAASACASFSSSVCATDSCGTGMVKCFSCDSWTELAADGVPPAVVVESRPLTARGGAAPPNRARERSNSALTCFWLCLDAALVRDSLILAARWRMTQVEPKLQARQSWLVCCWRGTVCQHSEQARFEIWFLLLCC